jgi:hypothetical protein
MQGYSRLAERGGRLGGTNLRNLLQAILIIVNLSRVALIRKELSLSDPARKGQGRVS